MAMMSVAGISSSRERVAIAGVCLAVAASCAGVELATVIARAIGVATLAPGAAGAVLGIAAAWVLRRRLALRLPAELDGWFARHRVAAVLWFIAAALAVGNTARVGVFIADPAQRWASAFPPMGSLNQHQ